MSILPKSRILGYAYPKISFYRHPAPFFLQGAAGIRKGGKSCVNENCTLTYCSLCGNIQTLNIAKYHYDLTEFD